MTLENLPNLNPFANLDEFHNHREGIYKFIYYCYDCIRNFETIKETDKCKFCNGFNLTKILSKKGTKKTTYRYFCQKCQNVFEINEKKTKCEDCDSSLVEIYKFNELDVMDQIKVMIKNSQKSKNRFFRHLTDRN